MLEILLVVVILAIASAVAVPMFARSFKGAKLRNSTRLVMMMHRNAQSKAVLGQRYMAILFDEVKGTLELVDQGQHETPEVRRRGPAATPPPPPAPK